MKTLSFHNYSIGYKKNEILIELNSQQDEVSFKSGLNLIAAPNGFGKTAFLQTLSGIIPALKGDVVDDGKQLDIEKDILYVSEYLSFPKYIYPQEWVDFLSQKYKKEELKKWVKKFDLEIGFEHFLGKMSQGERRKVTWLAAHFSKKPIILLDEPFDGLDILAIESAREMLNIWKQEERVVIIVGHQVGDFLDLMDEVFFIFDKKFHSMKGLNHANYRNKLLSIYK